MELERASVHDVFDVDPAGFESRTARCLIDLGAWRCRRIGVHPFGIVLLEMAVCLIVAHSRDDTRPLEEQFEAEYSDHPLWNWDFDDLGEAVVWLDQVQARLNTPNGNRFIERALGSALWHRIREALRADLRKLRPAISQWLNSVMPVAHALDVCLGTNIEVGTTTTTFLAAATEATYRLELFADGISTTGDTSTSLDSMDISVQASRMMRQLPELALSEIERMETPLRRKLSGARDVLGLTEDSVSQAANSAVEFVDRLLRVAFSDGEVLAWLDRHYPDKTDLVVPADNDARRPTKRARALCLLLAGQPPDDGAGLMEQIAKSLVDARNELERIKHSHDLHSVAVPDELLQAIAVVEAFVVLMLRVAWVSRDQARLGSLRERLRLEAAAP